MAEGSNTAAWRRLRDLTLTMSGLLFPLWTATAAPDPTAFPSGIAVDERQLATDRVTIAPEGSTEGLFASERKLSGQLSEARRVLLQLQDFVEDAERTAELGKQLKSRRLENSRLRLLLQANEAARRVHQINVDPSHTVVSRLTKTVVGNWLETVRLRQRSDDVNRDLIASERAWIALKDRLASIRRALSKRRTELRALKAESSALRARIDQTRQLILETRQNARRIERQQDQIDTETERLRRYVMSRLRAVLLDGVTTDGSD